MKVLVIGNSGQLARCLAALPPRDGVEIAHAGRPGVDIADVDTLREAIGRIAPDVVINTAAYTAVDKAESEPEAAFAINRDGAEAIARVTSERAIPIIHVSTDYVFDGRKSAPYVEIDRTGPAGVYGRSKLAGEFAVARANPRHVIARTSWLMSAQGNNFMKTMLRLARERDELRVVADQQGSPTYATDLAAALVAIACRMQNTTATDPRWGIYHVANRGAATWHEVARHVIAASAAHGARVVPVRAITTADYPTPAARPANSVLDSSKLASCFGIVLPDWRDRIADGVGELMQAPSSRMS